MLEQNCYRSYLKTVLVERISKNPAYSLRAFSRDLGVAPSTLSEVLKGSKKFSPTTAFQVAQRLGLDQSAQEYFVTLVQWDSAKTPEMKDALKRRIQSMNPKADVRDLSVDLFKTISDWYHLPILEMTRLDGFEFTPRKIASLLGITIIEAEVAIRRLITLELLEKTKQGRYRKTDNRLLSSSKIPNTALRNFHRQMLTKAIESLETQLPDEKLVGSETFAIDPDLLDEANAVTEEYFARMVKLSARGKKKTQVYHLGVQFFRLSKEQEKQ